MCCSALISIMMRFGEIRIKNNISTLAVNYVVCLLLGLFYAVKAGGTGSLIAPGADGRQTLMMGLLNGVFYVGSFILLQYNIGKNGVVLPSTFMKLGVLVPTMIAIVAFGERPGVMQIAGIAIAVAAIVFMNAAEKPSGTVTAPKALILLLLVGGSGDAMSKIYEELGNPMYNSQFLLYTFAMALVLCTLTAVLKGQKLTREDVLFGCLIGIPNYYSARFLLMSLSYVPAVIAYPTYSTGTIVLVGIAGVLFFREKMTSRQWVTVGMIAAALLMLNM
jgi:drug/metabolite transporter (DMT)-like permease